MSEEHGLLPAQHMKACLGWFIDTTLDFLVWQIHAAWHNEDGAVTLLSLNITKASDRVVPAWLLHNMRE